MRQLFYLLMVINLLLFLWIYQSEQQPEQRQTGHPAIGDLRIVSDDVLRRLKSDVMHDAEAPQEAVLQVQLDPLLQAEQEPRQKVEQNPLSPPHYLISNVEKSYVRAAKPGATPAPFKHSPPIKIVTSINGYEVVLSSISSYPAAVRIFDQLQPSAGVDADKSASCGDEKCLFFDVSRYFDAAEEGLFDAGHFIERDSAKK